MLVLAKPIVYRLQQLPQLTGWDIRTNLEEVDRSKLPAVDLRCTGAVLGGDRRGAVTLRPVWQITLAVHRGECDVEQLDQAMRAVLQSLHGWQPEVCGGCSWDALALQAITEPMYSDESGLVGYQLTFITAGVIKGQQ